MGELQRNGRFPEVSGDRTSEPPDPLAVTQHDSGMWARKPPPQFSAPNEPTASNAAEGLSEREAASYTSRITPMMPLPAWRPPESGRSEPLAPLPPAVTVLQTRSIDSAPAATPSRASSDAGPERHSLDMPIALSARPRRHVEFALPAEDVLDANESPANSVSLVPNEDQSFGDLSMEAFPLIRRIDRDFLSDATTLVRDSAAPVEPLWPPVQPDIEQSSVYPDADVEFELTSQPARFQPSLARRVFSKLLFVLIFSAVLALLVYEIALMYGITWADVRAFASRLT